MRRGSYLSRQIAQNVSRHTVGRDKPPTCADLAARIFDVVYRHGGTDLSFQVLALNAAHAAILADMRNAGRHVADCTQTITPRRETSMAAVSAVLKVESPEETQDRQQRYADTGARV